MAHAGSAERRGTWREIVGAPRKVEKAAGKTAMKAENEKAKMGPEPWAKATEAKPVAKARARKDGALKGSPAIVTIAASRATVPSGVPQLVKEEEEAR